MHASDDTVGDGAVDVPPAKASRETSKELRRSVRVPNAAVRKETWTILNLTLGDAIADTRSGTHRAIGSLIARSKAAAVATLQGIAEKSVASIECH